MTWDEWAAPRKVCYHRQTYPWVAERRQKFLADPLSDSGLNKKID